MSSAVLVKRRTPWVRIGLGLVYVASVIAIVFYERAAHEILGKAQSLLANQKYGAASVAFKLVVERYPLSCAVPRARAGLSAIEPAATRAAVPDRLRETTLERTFSDKMDPYVVDQLPLVGWPCSSALLFLVFVTRLLKRPGWAALALLFSGAASIGSVLLLGMAGVVPIGWAAEIVIGIEPLLSRPTLVYVATWVLLGTAALLTLSPASRRAKRPLSEGQPTEAHGAASAKGEAVGVVQAQAASPSSPEVTVAARLKRLEDLRSKSLLGEDEYRRERQRVLDSI